MKRIEWNMLDSAARNAALARPVAQRQAELEREVARLIAQVRADGDGALRALTRRFDGAELGDLAVSETEFAAAEAAVGVELRAAILAARDRIACFHRATMGAAAAVDTAPGVRCERVQRPIAAVGLYIPAGSAPLPSTALMLAVPAEIAGCGTVVAATPPRRDGSVDAAVLVALAACGVHRVFKLGGAQAIAAMAYGTASVPKCDKLFGPGNSWVTQAKIAVSADPAGAAIDLPAGPSEVLVIADASADPAFVASDLLAQAEHGPDSQVLLVTDAPGLVPRVLSEIEAQLGELPRAATARRALEHSRVIEVDSLAQAFEVSNAYAPEHLILQLAEPRRWLDAIAAAGSVFLGPWSPESIGDYCSGTNHVLPTNAAARSYSGVSVASFQKAITVQELTPAGLAGIGPDAMVLARAEGLAAHERAVAIRLQRLAQAQA
jgi:histidinol dehydrogenase